MAEITNSCFNELKSDGRLEVLDIQGYYHALFLRDIKMVQLYLQVVGVDDRKFSVLDSCQIKDVIALYQGWVGPQQILSRDEEMSRILSTGILGLMICHKE